MSAPGDEAGPATGPGTEPPRRAVARFPLDVLAAIAVGGVIGAEARFGLGLWWPHTSTEWPWATLVINTTGCFLIGALMVVLLEVVTPHRLVRPLLGVGVLGGYTTFSTYSVDVLALLHSDRPGAAVGYLVSTPVAAVIGVAVGMAVTRVAFRGRRVGGVGR
ncbi:MAG: fluoride efflux transporter CrcB [Pseudonocardia sp.]